MPNPQSGRLGPAAVLLDLKLGVVGKRGGAYSQRGCRETGGVCAHGVSLLKGEVLDYRRQHPMWQRRRVKRAPQIHGHGRRLGANAAVLVVANWHSLWRGGGFAGFIVLGRRFILTLALADFRNPAIAHTGDDRLLARGIDAQPRACRSEGEGRETAFDNVFAFLAASEQRGATAQ